MPQYKFHHITSEFYAALLHGFYVAKVLAPLSADTRESPYLDSDGSFPNHIPNPENEEAMESITEAVREMGAVYRKSNVFYNFALKTRLLSCKYRCMVQNRYSDFTEHISMIIFSYVFIENFTNKLTQQNRMIMTFDILKRYNVTLHYSKTRVLR